MNLKPLVKWIKSKQPKGPWIILVREGETILEACFVQDLNGKKFQEYLHLLHTVGLDIRLRTTFNAETGAVASGNPGIAGDSYRMTCEEFGFRWAQLIIGEGGEVFSSAKKHPHIDDMKIAAR